jgi:hypothetical protein
VPNNDGTAVNQAFIGDSQPCWVASDGAHVYWTKGPDRSIGRANADGMALTSTSSALDQTDTSVTVADSFKNASLAFHQGPADALMWDHTVFVGVAAADRSAKLTNDLFLY